jgi:hypothetical protein
MSTGLKLLVVAAGTAVVIAALFSGCVATKAIYSPKEHTVTVERQNNILEIGPCGMPWNYHDYFVVLLKEDVDRCDASQLELYGDHKLAVKSGHVTVNRANKTVTVNLTLLALKDFQQVACPFKYNGTFRYAERDPTPGMVNRKWFQDYYRTNEPSPYLLQ